MPKAKPERKVVHPNSRHAAQLARKAHRDNRDRERNKVKSSKVEILGDKLIWFQQNVDAEKTMYSKQEACELIELYMHRFDEELEQIEIVNSMKGRQGQQHLPRKQAITMTLERDRAEYESVGLEIPDILNGKVLKLFRDWNGEMRYVQNIKMRRVRAPDKGNEEKGLKKETTVVNKKDDDKEDKIKSSTDSVHMGSKRENVDVSSVSRAITPPQKERLPDVGTETMQTD